MAFKDRIRYFNRDFLNRVMRVLPSLSFGPFALVRHIGRKSGKPYETPIMVSPEDGGFIIALTYGSKVDWYRNVLHAGQCGLRWHGQEFHIKRIQPLEPARGLQAFPAFERFALTRMGIDGFAKLWSD